MGIIGSNISLFYKGNIVAMAVGASNIYNYHYDQLNRIVAMEKERIQNKFKTEIISKPEEFY